MDGKTLYVILTANAAAYDAALDRSGGKTRGFGKDVERTGRQIEGMNDSLSKSAVESRKASSEIDKMSGRLRVMVDALVSTGPAAIPIAAVLVPAVTALAAQLGIGMAAAGGLAIALMGVGDVMKAIEKARLDPTVENLTEVHRLMSDLAPNARAFVGELQEMLPALDRLQESAADEFFDGALDGLDGFRRTIPSLIGLVDELAGSAGDVASSLGDDMDSPRFREFVRFLEAEARPTMATLYETVANLASGAAEMWMAFDPLNDDASQWFLDQSEAFDQWADRLSESKDFAEFESYIRENAPIVAEALGDIGGAIVGIIEAAAPLGGPTLQIIGGIADVIGTVADSDLGTPIYAAAVALTLMNRGLAITEGIMRRMGSTATVGGPNGGLMAPVVSGTKAASSSIRTLVTDLRTMSQEYRRTAATTTRVTPSLFGTAPFGAGTSYSKGGGRSVGPLGSTATAMLSRTSAAAQRTAATLGQVTRAAPAAGAGLAAMAVMGTDAGRGMGLSNTAMLGLVGSMKGPWGAAAGAAVGLTLDFASANRKAADSVDEMDAALVAAGASMEARAAAVEKLRDDAAKHRDDVSTDSVGEFFTNMVDPDVISDFTRDAFGRSTQDEVMDKEADEAEKNNARIEAAFTSLGRVLGETDLNTTIESALPAMEALGVTVEDLANMDPSELYEFTWGVQDFLRTVDSEGGRTKAFAMTVADLGNEAISTADSATALGTAIEGLLSPALNAESATDAWHQSLKTLRAELQEGAGFEGYKQAAIENREITRDYADTAIERLTAMAGVSTTTQEDMAKAVAATRREFIASGIAAGIDRDVIVARANALGLTPALVRTVFEAVGVTEAEVKARQIAQTFRGLPKKVRTEIKAEGLPKTKADIDDLVRRYKLTEKQRQALVSIKNNASPELRKILGLLEQTDNQSPNPRVNAETEAAAAKLRGIIGLLFGIRDKSVTVTTNYRSTIANKAGPAYTAEPQADGGIWSGGTRRFADGGYGMDGTYYSRESQIVKGGANILWGEEETGFEAYISGKPSQRARNLHILNETARRFGMQLTAPGAAANGRYGSEPASGGYGGRTVVVRQQLPDRMTLVVDGRSFTAYVRGHAASVVDEADQYRARAKGAAGRMNWSTHG